MYLNAFENYDKKIIEFLKNDLERNRIILNIRKNGTF